MDFSLIIFDCDGVLFPIFADMVELPALLKGGLSDARGDV
jgi:hypothetical protein